MEPIWEYRWAFVEQGHWGGRKETNFWMTDFEAERWWAYGAAGTERLEDTRRDRNVARADTDYSSTGSTKPWDHPNYLRTTRQS
ncbi:hypothetical protein C7401_13663 [Paraburkholderia unamae]|uniref:hypothetical protein n=1 Tax=Paraburkholderia unamae TaxID=219649 RepID=UPI000DC50363|nr:hypothetical protein [Paraburkholderia unamae]RAR51703.1 hypothetical protein C7401_13663 [Paraburkholderia unamae]